MRLYANRAPRTAIRDVVDGLVSLGDDGLALLDPLDRLHKNKVGFRVGTSETSKTSSHDDVKRVRASVLGVYL